MVLQSRRDTAAVTGELGASEAKFKQEPPLLFGCIFPSKLAVSGSAQLISANQEKLVI